MAGPSTSAGVDQIAYVVVPAGDGMYDKVAFPDPSVVNGITAVPPMLVVTRNVYAVVADRPLIVAV